MKLIEILHGLPVDNVEEHGPLISFGNIVQACKLLGQDSSEIVELNLKELEKQGVLNIVHMKDPGFEDLIVGIKLATWN